MRDAVALPRMTDAAPVILVLTGRCGAQHVSGVVSPRL